MSDHLKIIGDQNKHFLLHPDDTIDIVSSEAELRSLTPILTSVLLNPEELRDLTHQCPPRESLHSFVVAWMGWMDR